MENYHRGADEISHLLDWPEALKIPLRFKIKVVHQIQEDYRQNIFTPVLNEESFEEITEIGHITLKTDYLASTEQSTIHAIEEYPEVVIKYQTDCIQEPNTYIHPILREFWFLQEVESLGISPKPLAVSPPANHPDHSISKCRFRTRSWRLCHSKSAVIRYAIMERVGPSLHSHLSGGKRFSFRLAIECAIQIINLLKTLHLEARVVHGDIHPGNICVAAEHPPRLLLIDYGSSHHIDDYPDDERIRPDRTWNHALFSPWEIAGFRPGPRDDVYKALLVVAFLFNGTAYYEYLRSLENNLEESIHLKLNGNIFLAYPHNNPLDDAFGTNPLTKARIAKILLNILDSVRALHSGRDMPDHDSIIHQFESILKVF